MAPDATPDLGSSSLDDILAHMGRESSQYRQEAESERADIQPKIEAAEKSLEKSRGEEDEIKAPDFKPMPSEPAAASTDPWQAFGSPAMILAALGGALTQTPLVTALNAGAGVMKATTENNQAEANRQMEIWKTSVENAQAANTFEMNKYRAAIEKMGSDRSSAIAELNAWSSAFNNTRYKDIIASNDDSAILNYFADMQKNTLALEKVSPQVEVFHNYMRSYAEEHNGQMPPPEEQQKFVAGLSKSASGAFDESTVDQTADLIANYKMPLLSSFALRSPWGQAVMAKVNEVNPDYNGTLYGERSKAVRDFGTGAQGNSVRSMNVAIAHLGTLTDLALALKNGDIQAINAAGNAIAAQTGSPAPTNFEAAKRIVAQEITKAIVPSGGGVTERDAAAKNADASNSPAQLLGVIETSKKLLAGQLKGLRQQYEQSTGLKNFEDMLSDETKQELEGIQTESTAKGTPPTVSTQEQFDALPKGAVYIGDDGNQYRKP